MRYVGGRVRKEESRLREGEEGRRKIRRKGSSGRRGWKGEREKGDQRRSGMRKGAMTLETSI